MKLSRTVWYAVQAGLQLAQSDQGLPVSCRRLASEGKLPERFLLQIFRHLAAHSILASTRGMDGGYCLNREPEDISLLEVIEAVDGPWKAELRNGDSFLPCVQTRLEAVLREIENVSRRELARVKLADLLPMRRR